MQYLTDEQEIYDLHELAKQEANQWKENYPEYERLADNGLLDDLDETLPEVNDGTLAAALFKLPKRVVNSKLKGRAKTLDRDEAWLTELANIRWENSIIPNANSQAPFHRKWKDAVRKAAIYGSVPIISLFVERGNYTGSDFIVAQPQDVLLEPGKVSDYDSDIFFWEVFYTKQQWRSMIDQAKEESGKHQKAQRLYDNDKSLYEKKNPGKKYQQEPPNEYNRWNVPQMEAILKAELEEEKDSTNTPKEASDKGIYKKGIKVCVVFQRGVNAPFYMYHKGTKSKLREWTNPDPTGDVPIHYLYCYQDFVNPYGIGIVQLAGGTQNVLDYMRQADVLATQLGFRPPVSIAGDLDETDLDSIVYEQDAQWIVGRAQVHREEISNQIYQQLPTRIGMYKTSLNQLIPTGDTSIGAGAGDPNYSKTPAGVKFQAANLSIDDEDFKDNLYMTYEAVAKSLINIEFANMQGSDLMKLSDSDRDLLMKAGLEFPVDENGAPTNELEILWDEVRAIFNFEMEAEQDKAKDDEKRLEALLKVAEFRATDPNFDAKLAQSGKKLNDGELYSEIITLTTDNDSILEDIDPEEQEAQAMAMEQAGMAQALPQAGQPEAVQQPAQNPELAQAQANVQHVQETYGVDEPTALAMLELERQGYTPEEIEAALVRNSQPQGVIA